jgi:hypothetical protein
MIATIQERYMSAVQMCSAMDARDLGVVDMAICLALTDLAAAGSRQVAELRQDLETVKTGRDLFFRLHGEADAKAQEFRLALEAERQRALELEAQLATPDPQTLEPEQQPRTPASFTWDSLSDDSEACEAIADMAMGKSWRKVNPDTRQRIARAAIQELTMRHGEQPTLATWDKERPTWMPTGTAITKLFGMTWMELLSQATPASA